MSTNSNKTTSTTIQEIKETFSPKIKLTKLQTLTKPENAGPFGMAPLKEVKSDAFYARVEALAAQHKPSFKDKYESKWENFYLPVQRDRKLICTAVSLFLSYKKQYHVVFVNLPRYSGVSVDKGDEPMSQEYETIFAEIERFLPLVETEGVGLIEALYPYEWRSGRIKRKYVVDAARLMSKEEGAALLAAYQKHLDKGLSVSEISLNDYLQTSAICYQAAFQDDIKQLLRYMDAAELTPKRLHQQWADNRHGGMLFLKDPDSPQKFMQWYRSREWEGAHPFEIVYSGNVHGITLYPPDEDELHYRLSVTDPDYNDALLKMVAALIENNVPFITYELDKIVAYCRGESYRLVNSMSMREFPFSYKDTAAEKKQYFSHIKWDAIQMVE